MRISELLKKFNESFGTKIFLIVTTFIIIISFSFTAFYIWHESKSLTETMIREGESLARLLAYNSRLGVFSENAYFLTDPVNGILQHKEALSVSIYTSDGKLLKEQRKPLKEKPVERAEKDSKKIIETHRESRMPFYFEAADTFEFWAPVISKAYPVEEELLFGDDLIRGEERTIGFVKVVFDKQFLNKRINFILFNGIVIAAIFLGLGLAVAYPAVRRVINPLNRLKEGVKALESGGSVEKIPVDTEDEIGKLAIAFNSMAESLKRKEAEKQHLEEQLRHAQKMEAIGTLAGGVAHDFSNILTAIMGYGSLIKMKIKGDDPLGIYVDRIIASSEKAAHLTQSLLAFSRKQIIDLKPVKLNEIVKSVEKLLSRLMGEDIELQTRLTGKNITVMADSGQIEQVLMNLATNARDAMPEGGLFTISTGLAGLDEKFIKIHGYGEPGMYALISVSDTGTGMDEKIKERIFEPFFTTKEVGKGTGLGLSTVYGIIKQHEGYINVYSEPGKGTTFKIYLPVIKSRVEEARSAETITPEAGTETVLIAEDDAEVRGFAKDTLEEFGYEVIEAVDGEDAIDKFRENRDRIQFVLLDIIMPKKNGREAYEEIKKIRPDIKALFISGYTADVIHRKGIIGEGLNFVSKPFSSDELLRKVREVLDK